MAVMRQKHGKHPQRINTRANNRNRKFLQHSMQVLDLSQYTLADAWRVDQAQINRLLNGTRTVRVWHLLAMECLLHRAGLWRTVKASDFMYTPYN